MFTKDNNMDYLIVERSRYDEYLHIDIFDNWTVHNNCEYDVIIWIDIDSYY